MSSVSPLSPNVSIVSIIAAFTFLNLWQKSSIQLHSKVLPFPFEMFDQDKKESSPGEAIPQAITSGLWLYNHHDLQVKNFLTHTLLYNLQI